jgi:histidinol-phosphate phosphatase family protein
MHPAVFLDRDDTLIANRSLAPPTRPHPNWRHGDLADPDRVRLLPGVLDACRDLKAAGFSLIVITNQGQVAHGSATLEDVHATNERLAALLSCAGSPLIDAVYSCPYHPAGSVPEFAREHHTRKPQPGMILQAARDHDIDLARSWLVGDAQRDIEAGIAAGLDPARCLLLGPDLPDMPAAARLILDQQQQDALQGHQMGR